MTIKHNQGEEALWRRRECSPLSLCDNRHESGVLHYGDLCLALRQHLLKLLNHAA